MGGTLKSLIHPYSSCVRGQLLLETKISLVMDQETLLLKGDAKKFVSTSSLCYSFLCSWEQTRSQRGMFTYLAALVARAVI